MTSAEMPSPVVAAAGLQDFVAALFIAAGVPEEDAAIVAGCLVEADLRGVVSHGVGRVPIYLHRIAIGLVDPRAPLSVTELAPVATLIDGANGLGFVTATRAMAEAMDRAGRCGIGLGYVRRGTHFGMAASYLLQAIAGGYAAFVFTNASPAMPIWGGRTPFLGTSPFAFGAPGGTEGPALVLDMATSVVARGKIRRAAATGGTIPAGWALDRDGNPTVDAKAAYDGIILPLGGPKGSGLSLMMEVLGGVMSGAAFGGEVGNQYSDEGRPQDVGHLFVALRPDLAVSAAEYRSRMDALARRAKACPPVEPGTEILFPGEPEARLAERHRREGIPLSAEDRAGLAEAATKLGVKLPDFLA